MWCNGELGLLTAAIDNLQCSFNHCLMDWGKLESGTHNMQVRGGTLVLKVVTIWIEL